MDQMAAFWEACQACDHQEGSFFVQDSTDALNMLLEAEKRLSVQIKQSVDSAVEWCKLAGACVQGMKAWELADRGESAAEFKGKREMFEMLRKLHRKVRTAVQPNTGMVITGMPVGEHSNNTDENVEHLLMVLARTNEECTLESLKYVAGVRQVNEEVLEELVKGMGVMRQDMEETGSCLSKFVEEVREAARLYEGSMGLLGGVSEDDTKETEEEEEDVAKHSEARNALTKLVDLHRMVDALL